MLGTIALSGMIMRNTIQCLTEDEPDQNKIIDSVLAMIEEVPLEQAIEKAHQEASIAKIPYAIELSEEILEEGYKVVIFSRFVEPVRQINEHFKDISLKLTGDTPQHERLPLVNRFNADPEIKVWVSTAQVGGVGLNLTGACYVIMLDRQYTPGDVAQCECRIDRIGQTKPCTSYWIRYGYLDSMFDEQLAEKADRIKTVMGDRIVSINNIDQYDEIDVNLVANKLFNVVVET